MNINVETLMRGSAELDRMHSEIKQVVNIFMSNRFHSQFRDTFKTQFREISWRVNHSIVSLHVDDNNLSTGHLIDRIPLRLIQRAHQSLDSFIQGMLRKCPKLEERLQPIMDAAMN